MDRDTLGISLRFVYIIVGIYWKIVCVITNRFVCNMWEKVRVL